MQVFTLFHRRARSCAVIAVMHGDTEPRTKQAQAKTNEDIMKIPNIDKRLKPLADDPNSVDDHNIVSG
jgi:hypothetical protein